MQEGTDAPDIARPDGDGPSDTQRETQGQCKCTELKKLLFESFEDEDGIV